MKIRLSWKMNREEILFRQIHSQMACTFQSSGLNVAIFPQSRFDPDINAWAKFKRSDGWWNSWFARYRTFLLNYADLANASKAKALIIGEEGMLPALLNGKLPDNSPSGVPLDADIRWTKLIKEIRQRFQGYTYSGILLSG